MAKRPLNRCGACGKTWYPRGADKSGACPKCGTSAGITTSVEEKAQQSGRCCCCVLVLCSLAAAVVFGTGPMSWKDPVGQRQGGRPPAVRGVAPESSAQPAEVESTSNDGDFLGEARDLRHAAGESFGGRFRAQFVGVQGEPSFGRGLLVALESAEQPGQHGLTVWFPESLVQRLEGDGTLPRLIQQKPSVVLVLIPGVGDQSPGVSRLEVE